MAATHMGASKHEGVIQTWVVSKHMGASKHTRGIQTYWGHPNIQGGVQTYGGHSNIQGYIQTYVGTETYDMNIWILTEAGFPVFHTLKIP